MGISIYRDGVKDREDRHQCSGFNRERKEIEFHGVLH